MKKAFEIVVLGCTGGPKEINLSGYLLRAAAAKEWITLDGGSLLSGMDIAFKKGSFKDVKFSNSLLSQLAELFQEHIKAYLISHAHLDHIVGLIINSQCDSKKTILGLDPTIDNLRDFIFNGRIWPNYGNEGADQIRQYQYLRLSPHKKTEIPETEMSVEAFLLSHPKKYPSTAFLIEHRNTYLLYFGDTSSDSLEKEKNIQKVWKRVAPLVQEKKLHAVMLECSYPKKEGHLVVHGHLDTKLLMHEFHHLAEIANVSLEGLNVIVTHRKENIALAEENVKMIEMELNTVNDLRLNLIFPTQGEKIGV